MYQAQNSHIIPLVKGSFILGFLFLFMCFGYSIVKAEDEGKKKYILVGGDHYYPPYEFLDERGLPTGFNVELTMAIAELMGVDVDIKLGPWSQMRKALEEGKIDTLQGMVFSEERTQFYDFSPPHSVIHQSIFARKNSPSIRSLDDLRGKEIIVQKNGIMHDYLNSRDEPYTLIEKDTHAEALRLLASGKHDYAVVANLPGLYFSQELELSNLVRVAEPMMAGSYGYAVRKGDAETLALFSEGLSVLKNTGRYHKIKNKWLSPLESDRIALRKFIIYGLMVVVPLLLVLIVISVWNKALHRKIALATADLQKEIVQRKKAAEESEAKQQQLIQADKMATIGILVSGVAHEINNPTGLLLFNLPVFKKIFRVVQDTLDERYEESGDFLVGAMKYSMLREQIPNMLDEMEDSAQRIKRIVSDLKDFARMETPELNENINLNDVVKNSVRLLSSTIKKSTERFSFQSENVLPLVLGSSQRLEQVLVNLLVNCCQALTTNTQKITVRTYFDTKNNEVCVQVKDEGEGMDEETLAHIFDPFYTTKRGEGGTGLGLSVSSGIVKEHGGRLSFASSPGIGTTATMAIPISQTRR